MWKVLVGFDGVCLELSMRLVPLSAVGVAANALRSAMCFCCAGKLLRSGVNAMAAASAVEETSYGLSEPETLLDFLEDAGVRLVRLEYLIELRESGRPWRRRQDAEQETTSLGLPALVERGEPKEVEIDPITAHMSVMIRHPEPSRSKSTLSPSATSGKPWSIRIPGGSGLGQTWEGLGQGVLERTTVLEHDLRIMRKLSSFAPAFSAAFSCYPCLPGSS